jgi:hypothetical protein
MVAFGFVHVGYGWPGWWFKQVVLDHYSAKTVLVIMSCIERREEFGGDVSG